MMSGYEFLSSVHWHKQMSSLPSIGGVQYGFAGAGDEPPEFYGTKQVHGDTIVAAPAPGREADGIYSRKSGETVGVVTADCLPVLLMAPTAGCVAAVHAGWRGLVGGILWRAGEWLQKESVGSDAVHVVLGPAISAQVYEVGFEVIEAWLHSCAASDELRGVPVAKGFADRWYFDLRVAACLQLFHLGVPAQQIHVFDTCTREDLAWHSYRREGPGCGRNVSWVSLT